MSGERVYGGGFGRLESPRGAAEAALVFEKLSSHHGGFWGGLPSGSSGSSSSASQVPLPKACDPGAGAPGGGASATPIFLEVRLQTLLVEWLLSASTAQLLKQLSGGAASDASLSPPARASDPGGGASAALVAIAPAARPEALPTSPRAAPAPGAPSPAFLLREIDSLDISGIDLRLKQLVGGSEGGAETGLAHGPGGVGGFSQKPAAAAALPPAKDASRADSGGAEARPAPAPLPAVTVSPPSPAASAHSSSGTPLSPQPSGAAPTGLAGFPPPAAGAGAAAAPPTTSPPTTSPPTPSPPTPSPATPSPAAPSSAAPSSATPPPGVPLFFHHLDGASAPALDTVTRRRISEAFAGMPGGRMDSLAFQERVVVGLLNQSRYLAMHAFRRVAGLSADAEIDGSTTVSEQQLVNFWNGRLAPEDETLTFFNIIRGDHVDFIWDYDLNSAVRYVMERHPGLCFLGEAPDFQKKYMQAVVTRLLYELDPHRTNKVTLAELRAFEVRQRRRALLRQRARVAAAAASGEPDYSAARPGSAPPPALSLAAVWRHLDLLTDLNDERCFFSYEHFYVTYCLFWELDSNSDNFIDKLDLLRYDNHALGNRTISRVMAVFGGKSSLSFEDFLVFLMHDEDKTSDRALRFWFDVLDLDGDGYVRYYEMQYFYEDQRQRLESLEQDSIEFEDVLCQMNDCLRPARPAQFSLADFKRNRRAGAQCLDMLLSLSKLLAHESRDPFLARQEATDFPDFSPWDRFCHAEYERFSVEDDGDDMPDDAEPDDDLAAAPGAAASAPGAQIGAAGAHFFAAPGTQGHPHACADAATAAAGAAAGAAAAAHDFAAGAWTRAGPPQQGAASVQQAPPPDLAVRAS